jgi:hypothetical protein
MSRVTKNILRLTLDQSVKQSTFVRKLNPGDFIHLKNVRRPEDGPPEKRTGYDRTTIDEFFEGTYTGPAVDLVPSDTLMVRDSAATIWAKNGDTARARGTDLRAFPTYQQVESQAEGRCHKPLQVVRDGEIWEFSLGVMSGSDTGYQVTVLDATTRQPLRETVAVAADGIVAYTAVADDDDNIWLLYLSSNDDEVITAHKWTTTTAAHAVTTYVTLTGYQLTSISARFHSDTGEVAVAATSFVAGSPNVARAWWSYLDPATGQAKASPAPVAQTTSTGDGSDHLMCNGVRLMMEDAADGFFRLAYFRLEDTGEDVSIVRVRVNATTLAVDNTSTMQTFDIPVVNPPIGVCAGYLDDAGDEYWASTLLQPFEPNNLDNDNAAGLTNVSSAVVHLHIHSGGSTTNGTLARSAYLAGDPVNIDGQWYWLTGFQDADHAQRGYFLRNHEGVPMTPLLEGEGGEVYFAGGQATAVSGIPLWRQECGHLVTPQALDGNIVAPLLRQGLTALSPVPVIATIDLDPTIFSRAPGVLPGGIPKRVSPIDFLTELSPVHSPYEPLIIVNNGPGPANWSVNVCSYRYLIQDADGTIRVSSPAPLQTLTFETQTIPDDNYTVRVPTNRHVIGRSYIAFYGSADGATDPFLQTIIVNDPSVDYIDIPVVPTGWADTGETLDTLGGALEQAPPPPCRLAAIHRERLFLAGTPDDSIWPSQEFEPGRGPEFNEALAFEWADGTGPVTAICSMNHDTLVLFREDRIGTVTGPGPDGNAQNGAYQVGTAPGNKGASNPRAVCVGTLGVYFKCHQDDRFYLFTGGAPTDISAGIEDYLGETITGVAFDETHRLVRWYCASGKILIIDNARATESSPVGQWYVDEGDGLQPAIAAAVIGGVAVGLEAGEADEITTFVQGSGYTDDGEEILQDMTFGPNAPAGMLGEFSTYECHVSSTALGGDSQFNYIFTNDEGTPEQHVDAANGTADVQFMTGLDRTREFYVRIQETSATGRGRRFDGLAITIGVFDGRTQNPRRRIS